MDDIPQPDNFKTVSNYKKAVYDHIDGVGSWLLDMRLSIKYKQHHNQNLNDAEKELKEAVTA